MKKEKEFELFLIRQKSKESPKDDRTRRIDTSTKKKDH